METPHDAYAKATPLGIVLQKTEPWLRRCGMIEFVAAGIVAVTALIFSLAMPTMDLFYLWVGFFSSLVSLMVYQAILLRRTARYLRDSELSNALHQFKKSYQAATMILLLLSYIWFEVISYLVERNFERYYFPK